MDKKIAVISCSLWILGLSAFIVGLNMDPPVRDWMTVIGTIVFLLGLGGQGILWAKRRNEPEQPEAPAAPAEPESGEENGKEKDAPKDA